MALKLADKQAIVADVSQAVANASSAVAADYRGLSVTEMTDMRRRARDAGVYVRVVRNTLARRVVEDTDFACMKDALVGPLLLAFSYEEPGAAAKLIRDFAKDHDKLEVKVLAMGGQLLEASQLNALASLPTRDEAIAQLMSVMTAPITQLARTLSETYATVVRAVHAVAEQKQAN